MKPELYEQFLRLKEHGKKEEARTYLLDFIASFQTFDEKKIWVRGYLVSSDIGHKIRHEIYENLVFPVLLDGYKQKDAWSTLWLATTWQSLYASKKCHETISWKDAFTLLKEAYALEPSTEVRERLLKAELDWFEYSQHEWPAGILYGWNGASLDECQEILREIAFARSLDKDAAHEEFLAQFEGRVVEYMDRLMENDE